MPAGRRGRISATRGAKSAPTIKYLGSAILMECASTSPASCELINAATTPMRVNPNQIATYSAQFVISTPRHRRF